MSEDSSLQLVGIYRKPEVQLSMGIHNKRSISMRSGLRTYST